MSKEKKEEQEENAFEGFSFLDAPAPPAKKEPTKEVKEKVQESEELSPEEIEALDKAAKQQVATKDKKSKIVKEEKEEVEEEQEEEEEDPKGKSSVEEETDENEFLGFAKFLADKAIVDLSDEDKIETEEDLADIIGKTVKNGIDSYKKSIPEDGQKFLEFLESGGNPADFHKYYYNDASFENFDIEDEDNQKYVIKESLKLEGYTDEEADDEINDLLDLAKLDKKASIHLKKLQKIEKEQKEILIESQKEYARQEEARRKAKWENFKKGLMDKEEIGGFKFTPKMKGDLWDYMSKPVDRKTGATQYQIDSKENEDARYMFAYLLKNKWDVKSLERQVETKTVSKLKSKLANYTDSRNKMKSPKTTVQQEDNSNPFAGFKQLQ